MGKIKLHEEIAERMDLPPGAAGLLRLSLSGNRRALVEDFKGVLEYTSERVTINGGTLKVTIRGEKLEIEAMDAAALLVTGRILAVELG